MFTAQRIQERVNVGENGGVGGGWRGGGGWGGVLFLFRFVVNFCIVFMNSLFIRTLNLPRGEGMRTVKRVGGNLKIDRRTFKKLIN